MLLLFTVLADWSYIIASLFTILTLLYIAVKRPGGSSPVLEEPNSVRAYITSYRVIVMIITILCILAVDFRIFPRRYAKTETYGASLAVELWLVDKAVLPIENSADGSIHRNYDLLLQHKLNLVGEVQLRANHCLLGLPGVTMEELVSVVSHPQALAQCRTVLNDLGVDKVRDQDTAVAAKTVAINCVRHTGAIASSRAAEIYGLDILAEGIQDDDENVTRFLVLAREPRIPGTDRPHKCPQQRNQIDCGYFMLRFMRDTLALGRLKIPTDYFDEFKCAFYTKDQVDEIKEEWCQLMIKLNVCS
ncbi:arogenate dehydratase/prephenate dehydratase 1, chloroplastic [Lathyrus oleraceus]|uniref:arogenate dehydratase/prephenate dehydratase 1, chloroplastic n=1 Tax=Pisum sativum TaxID=3888 RepID=UPI0021D33E62|nr:arogenate dehydratase/prephenate dehydratase 1, chloroplastic-like [Pisum sativum]